MDVQNINAKTNAQTAPKLSVVAPCYNEEQSISVLASRLTASCVTSVGDDYEIVLVNDGSKDTTWDRICALAAQDKHIIAVNLSRNHGHQLALSAGLTICRGQRILIIDADLQDPPELLGKMMALMDQGADIVYGQRTQRRGETIFKRSSAALFYRILNRLVEIDIPQDTGDFRLISRRAVDILNTMPERSRFIRGMVSWIGLRQVPLKYERDARYAGETKYPLRKMIRFALDAVTSFSTVPMRIASYVGLVTGCIGLFSLVYIFITWFQGRNVQGWTSLMVIVLVIGSAQLLCLGVFGEYLGRLYMESKRRPLFIIDEIVCAGQTKVISPSESKESDNAAA